VNERQPALDGDRGGIARASLRDEFFDQALAHDVELLGDDRPDRRVIRRCAAVDRDRFIGMIDKRLDAGPAREIEGLVAAVTGTGTT
jgi:hypothetical protein